MIAHEMLQAWTLFAQIALSGLAAGALLLIAMRARTKAPVPVRVRRR